MRFFLLFLLIFQFHLFAKEGLYPEFIQKQIELTLKLNDNNIDEKEIEEILDKKAKLFEQKLEDTLANKQQYIMGRVDFLKKFTNSTA